MVIRANFKKLVDSFCRLMPPAVGSNSVPAAVALLLSQIAINNLYVSI